MPDVQQHAEKKRTRYRVCAASDIPEGGKKIVSVEGIEIGIFRVRGNLYGWRNICPHAHAPVCEGVICGTRLPSPVYEYEYGRDREILRCPWHGWEFDLLTGQHLAEKDGVRLKGYKVVAEGEDVYVEI